MVWADAYRSTHLYTARTEAGNSVVPHRRLSLRFQTAERPVSIG